jgi:uncharacterized protein with von Willebrand factor type A (vWA) domain
MNLSETEELPLLNLFTRLREAGLPLGIDEYRLILTALQKGFGTSDRESLADLCRALWVKSKDEEHLFNYHFQQVMSQPQNKPAENEPAKPVEPSRSPSGVSTTSRSESPNLPSSVPVSQELMEVEDEIRVAQAVQMATQRDEEIGQNRFLQTDEYFPVTRRQMKQSWRHLRRFVRTGLATELDVEATIERIGQQGILLEPVLVPSRINQTELVLLLDQKGSMVPFHALGDRLAETALRGGRLGRTDIYYFHNCPARYLYRDAGRRQAELVTDLLERLRSQNSTILVFSDAGAARGGFSEERLDLTERFLEQLKQHVRYVTWLNPVEKSRWSGTTAGEIAQFVPMFELSRRGLEGAIGVLRGRQSQA